MELVEHDHRPSGSPGEQGQSLAARCRYLLDPVPRAVLYGVRSWQRARRPGDGGVPSRAATPALVGHALLDEVLLAGFRMTGPARSSAERGRILEEAEAAAILYRDLGWLDRPSEAWDVVRAAVPALERPHVRWGRAGAMRYERLSFDSAYEPHPLAPARDRWLAYDGNRWAKAWVLRHRDDHPRPWIVLVHGRSMGRPLLDFNLLRARWLHEGLGLNIAMPLLPLHGPRRRELPAAVSFPGEDLLDNVHGTQQSVHDVLRLLTWIRAGTDGDTPLAVAGVSLGGLVTALVTSVDDGLSGAILGVPVVDLAELLAHHAPRSLDPQQRRWVEAARELGPLVSPLVLEPRVPWEGRAVYGGHADRLAHPRHQVGRIWEHWGRPRALWYDGGHAGFSRTRSIEPFLLEALTGAGLVEGPAS